MTRIPVRSLFAAALLFIALPQGAGHAQESQVWTEKSDEGRASLAYGPLDPSKTPLFLLTCFNNMDVAVLEMFAEANEVKVKPVLEVLRAPRPLTVNLGLTNKTLSDQGRADAVEKFDQACELD